MRTLLFFLVLSTLTGACRKLDSKPAASVHRPRLSVSSPDSWPYSLADNAPRAKLGMVSTDARLATEVGVRVLREGGNAIDAAVATAFALAVVFPQAGNLGGGGFLILRTGGGKNFALDFREVAPAASTRDMYLDPDGQLTDKSRVGALAAGVPGSVAGLWAMHQRFGKSKWKSLVGIAADLAEHGFVVDEEFAQTVAGKADKFSPFPSTRHVFFGASRPVTGAAWKNPDLAATLRRIADQGRDGFYLGKTAGLVVAEMKRGGGIITHKDLREYQPVWREPVVFMYRRHQVVSMPPPSSGGLVLALMAGILSEYDLSAMGPGSVDERHVLIESMRRAFALRNSTLGDPDFVKIPVERFLSADSAAVFRSGLSLTQATPSSAIKADTGTDQEGTHTTNLSVVDRDGMAVALTTTINDAYGSRLVVDGAGFLLNNEMDDFTAKPGEPNMYGLVQGAANAVAPKKRMLSSMTPTIVADPSGRVLLVTGAAGGPRIITAVFQIISNVIDHHMNVSSAVGSPRVHHQHLPDLVYYERGGLPKPLAKQLKARGHTITERGAIGDAPTVLRDNGMWTGNPEPRQRGGLAAGH